MVVYALDIGDLIKIFFEDCDNLSFTHLRGDHAFAVVAFIVIDRFQRKMKDDFKVILSGNGCDF